MFTVLNYFKARYLGEKGQGIVEYALLLGVVVALAAVLLGSSGTTGLKGAINSAIGKVTTQLGKS